MKKIIKILVSAILSVAMLGCFTACEEPPKEVFVGFDTDLAKAVGEELGLEIEFVEINWDLKESLLNSGEIDLVWNGFTYTEDRDNGYYDEEREQQIGGLDFTNFYMENKQVAVVKKSQVANFTSNASFAGKVGCAEASSAGAKVITTILGQTANELPKQIDTFTAVKSGTCDYAVIDSSMASVYVQSENGAYNKDLAVVQIGGVEVEYYAVCCKQGSNLVSVVNYALAKAYKSGKATQIANTYGLGGVLFDGFSDVDTASFQLPTDGQYKNCADKGKIVVGYTLFAPMNYFELR